MNKSFKEKLSFAIFIAFVAIFAVISFKFSSAPVHDANWPIAKACNTNPDQTPLIDGKSPAYYCGKLAVNGAMFGLGTVSNIGASKIINRFGVGTTGAKIGKSKLANAAKTDEQWADVKNGIMNNPKTRTLTLERMNKLDSSTLDGLLTNAPLSQKFFSSQKFSKFLTNKKLQHYIHVFNGDEGGGWHYYPTGRSGSIRNITVKGLNGVYRAKVQIMINGKLSPPKTSTFFPDHWSEDEVLEAINMAYENILVNKSKYFVPKSNNSYRYTVNSVELELYLNNNTGEFISAFPAETTINGF